MAKKINYAALYTLRSDGRYQGHYTDKDGKRHSVCHRDPETLFHIIEKKEAPEDTSLKAIGEQWAAEFQLTAKDRTWKNYKPHYERILEEHGEDEISEITGEFVLQDMLAAKNKGYSKTVVNTIRVIYSGIFTYAAGKGKILYNPALAVKLPKNLKQSKRRAPTDKEIDTIIANREDGFGFVPFALLCTGVRRNELIKRPKTDIDIKNWELNIPSSKSEAGVRSVPIIEPLRDLLLKQMNAHPNSPWLFPSPEYNGHGGEHLVMSDTNYDTLWLEYCEKVGWIGENGKPTLTAHNLRHGTATLLYESGVDVYTAKAILGHAHIETTMAIYTELRDKHKKKGFDKFSVSMNDMVSNAVAKHAKV